MSGTGDARCSIVLGCVPRAKANEAKFLVRASDVGDDAGADS